MTIGLKIGDLAPDFKGTAVGGIYGGGQEVKLADFAGSTLVLYFYPKDGTPGCTAQACELRDSWGELQSIIRFGPRKACMGKNTWGPRGPPTSSTPTGE